MHLLVPLRQHLYGIQSFLGSKRAGGWKEVKLEGRSSAALVRLGEDIALFHCLQTPSCLGYGHSPYRREVQYLQALKDQVQLLKVRSTETVDELRQKDL